MLRLFYNPTKAAVGQYHFGIVVGFAGLVVVGSQSQAGQAVVLVGAQCGANNARRGDNIGL